MIRTHGRSAADQRPHRPHPMRLRSGMFRPRRTFAAASRSATATAAAPSSALLVAAPPERAGAPSRRAEPAAASAPSQRSLLICGIAGLVLFPIAGAAMLGHVVGPVVFLFFATVAVALFGGSLSKLESSSA